MVFPRKKFRIVPRSRPLRPHDPILTVMGLEAEGLVDFQGLAGIICIAWWNLHL